MNREDWSELKDIITLGVIPGGTGNGLIKSLLNENNEQYGIKEAAWLIIKG
jgi:diacylglycerol kinase family enzyme